MWKPLRWLRRSGRSKAIPEIITLLQQSRIHSARMAPLIIERKSIYYSWWRWSRSRVWALFETREVRDSEFDVILCLRGTLLASQHRKIERKRTFKALDSLSEWKSSLCLARFGKHAQKLYCLTQSRSQTTPRLLIDLFTDTAAILH